MADNNTLYDVKGVCAYLGICEKTCLKLFQSGDIGGRKVGRQWKTTQAMLDKYMAGEAIPDEARAIAQSGKRKPNKPKEQPTEQATD